MILAIFVSCGGDKPRLKTPKTSAPYKFEAEKNWLTERISFPIEFAPQIPYKGIEDLRFAPGWEFTSSGEHWTYSFLWWLDGKTTIDSSILKKYLEEYYTGLLSQNVRQRNIPVNKISKPVAMFVKVDTEKGDIETYTGTIKMLNYLDMLFDTITLNCVIHKKECSQHTAIIFQVSPKPYGHKIWQQLNKMEAGFECD